MIPEKASKVAYLLGAGASANALPIVADMPAAFRQQRVWIGNLMGREINGKVANKYFTYLDGLAIQSQSFGTVDTYARSLQIRRDLQSLNILKVHFSMFFLLEQAIENKAWVPVEPGSKAQAPAYQRQQRIDTRYMGWLALLLDNMGHMTNRVNVLSWNYDLQLEHALGLHTDTKDLGRLPDNPSYGIYPNLDGSVPTTLPFLVHLNGVAGLIQAGGAGTTCLYSGLNTLDPKAYINRMFEVYDRYDHQEGMLEGTKDTLNFAWEQKPISLNAMKLAKDVLERSDILVIIGYSFPSFNRPFDKELIDIFSQRHIGQSKSIVVQGPAANAEGFRDMFESLDSVDVFAVTEKEQFYIPPELF